MNENEIQRFEEELRGVAPAQPPASLIARLKSARAALDDSDVAQATQADVSSKIASEKSAAPGLRESVRVLLNSWILRYLVPAAALVIVAVIVWRVNFPPPRPAEIAAAPPTTPAIEADNVQIDRELVSSFDTIAELPDGEPIRIQCRAWMDEVVMEDRNLGVVVEQRTPRVELVPVKFETY